MKQIAPLQQLKLCQRRGAQRKQSRLKAVKEDLGNFPLLTPTHFFLFLFYISYS